MTAATTDRAAVLPSVVSVSRSRARVELKEFFRQREAVVFTVLLPVLLLVVFGAVLNYDIGSGVTFVQYFMAGIIAAGILALAARLAWWRIRERRANRAAAVAAAAARAAYAARSRQFREVA